MAKELFTAGDMPSCPRCFGYNAMFSDLVRTADSEVVNLYNCRDCGHMVENPTVTKVDRSELHVRVWETEGWKRGTWRGQFSSNQAQVIREHLLSGDHDERHRTNRLYVKARRDDIRNRKGAQNA